MIIIGSYPIRKHLGREVKDLDLLCTLEEFRSYTGCTPIIKDSGHAYAKKQDTIYDAEIIWPGTGSLELAELILRDSDTVFDEDVQAWIPGIDVLYMLKMSHRYKKNTPHFVKTMSDIKLMRYLGAKIKDEHRNFYEARKAATYWYSHPKLSQNKDTFFDPDDSFYVYDHDSIHETVAVDSKPAYTKYAVEGEEVLSSKEKFFQQSYQVRLNGVYEEACVLALERSQIPNDFKIPPNVSFMKALEKVCTSITSGWFREFAWENYYEVVLMYKEKGLNDYVEAFHSNHERLKPYVPLE